MSISFDSSSQGNTTGATLIISHTVASGSNRVLIATFANQVAGTISNVLYNGVAMTRVNFQNNSAGSGLITTYMYVLSNPDTGTHDFEVTRSVASGRLYGNVLSYQGVDQTDPIDTFSRGIGSGSTSQSAGLTTLANNSWTVWGIYADNGISGSSPSGITTLRGSIQDGAWGAYDSNSAIIPAGSTSLGLTSSNAFGVNTCWVIASLRIAGVTNTYATWNPSDKGAGVTLSGNDLTVTIGTTPGGVRSTIGKNTGKWYWESLVVTIDTATNPMLQGFGNSSAAVSGSNPYPGSDTDGWGYFGTDGKKYNNNIGTAYGALYTTNDVIGFALDMDAGELTFYKNGVSQGTAFSSITGTIFALVGGYYSNNPGAQITTNFGDSAFTYPPPAGFNPGLFIVNESFPSSPFPSHYN